MKVLKCFAITSRVLPMLVAAIALAVATNDAFAKNGHRSGTGKTETRSPPAGGGTAAITQKPPPGRPTGKPLPPIPIDPGKGDVVSAMTAGPITDTATGMKESIAIMIAGT